MLLFQLIIYLFPRVILIHCLIFRCIEIGFSFTSAIKFNSIFIEPYAYFVILLFILFADIITLAGINTGACQNCFMEFSSAEDMGAHLLGCRFTMSNQFKCLLCSVIEPTSHELNLHFSSAHSSRLNWTIRSLMDVLFRKPTDFGGQAGVAIAVTKEAGPAGDSAAELRDPCVANFENSESESDLDDLRTKIDSYLLRDDFHDTDYSAEDNTADSAAAPADHAKDAPNDKENVDNDQTESEIVTAVKASLTADQKAAENSPDKDMEKESLPVGDCLKVTSDEAIKNSDLNAEAADKGKGDRTTENKVDQNELANIEPSQEAQEKIDAATEPTSNTINVPFPNVKEPISSKQNSVCEPSIVQDTEIESATSVDQQSKQLSSVEPVPSCPDQKTCAGATLDEPATSTLPDPSTTPELQPAMLRLDSKLDDFFPGFDVISTDDVMDLVDIEPSLTPSVTASSSGKVDSLDYGLGKSEQEGESSAAVIDNIAINNDGEKENVIATCPVQSDTNETIVPVNPSCDNAIDRVGESQDNIEPKVEQKTSSFKEELPVDFTDKDTNRICELDETGISVDKERQELVGEPSIEEIAKHGPTRHQATKRKIPIYHNEPVFKKGPKIEGRNLPPRRPPSTIPPSLSTPPSGQDGPSRKFCQRKKFGSVKTKFVGKHITTKNTLVEVDDDAYSTLDFAIKEETPEQKLLVNNEQGNKEVIDTQHLQQKEQEQPQEPREEEIIKARQDKKNTALISTGDQKNMDRKNLVKSPSIPRQYLTSPSLNPKRHKLLPDEAEDNQNKLFFQKAEQAMLLDDVISMVLEKNKLLAAADRVFVKKERKEKAARMKRNKEKAIAQLQDKSVDNSTPSCPPEKQKQRGKRVDLEIKDNRGKSSLDTSDKLSNQRISLDITEKLNSEISVNASDVKVVTRTTVSEKDTKKDVNQSQVSQGKSSIAISSEKGIEADNISTESSARQTGRSVVYNKIDIEAQNTIAQGSDIEDPSIDDLKASMDSLKEMTETPDASTVTAAYETAEDEPETSNVSTVERSRRKNSRRDSSKLLRSPSAKRKPPSPVTRSIDASPPGKRRGRSRTSLPNSQTNEETPSAEKPTTDASEPGNEVDYEAVCVAAVKQLNAIKGSNVLTVQRHIVQDQKLRVSKQIVRLCLESAAVSGKLLQIESGRDSFFKFIPEASAVEQDTVSATGLSIQSDSFEVNSKNHLSRLSPPKILITDTDEEKSKPASIGDDVLSKASCLLAFPSTIQPATVTGKPESVPEVPEPVTEKDHLEQSQNAEFSDHSSEKVSKTKTQRTSESECSKTQDINSEKKDLQKKNFEEDDSEDSEADESVAGAEVDQEQSQENGGTDPSCPVCFRLEIAPCVFFSYW